VRVGIPKRARHKRGGAGERESFRGEMAMWHARFEPWDCDAKVPKPSLFGGPLNFSHKHAPAWSQGDHAEYIPEYTGAYCYSTRATSNTNFLEHLGASIQEHHGASIQEHYRASTRNNSEANSCEEEKSNLNMCNAPCRNGWKATRDAWVGGGGDGPCLSLSRTHTHTRQSWLPPERRQQVAEMEDGNGNGMRSWSEEIPESDSVRGPSSSSSSSSSCTPLVSTLCAASGAASCQRVRSL